MTQRKPIDKSWLLSNWHKTTTAFAGSESIGTTSMAAKTLRETLEPATPEPADIDANPIEQQNDAGEGLFDDD